jgi:small neutral amino acid transporter SnatA (MarC family)
MVFVGRASNQVICGARKTGLVVRVRVLGLYQLAVSVSFPP